MDWLYAPATVPAWVLVVLGFALGGAGVVLADVSLALQRQCRMNERLLREAYLREHGIEMQPGRVYDLSGWVVEAKGDARG